MGLNPEELEQHCQRIMGDRRNRNKIVILCEGKAKNKQSRLSPQSYKRMSQMPDSNFYLKCIPKTWKGKSRPSFVHCEDSNGVIKTYNRLQELADRPDSPLNIAKLFALVDLDIQPKDIDNYKFATKEEIFHHSYQKTEVIRDQAPQNRIWVTGLIHKEAYFIAPEVQPELDRSKLIKRYCDGYLSLKEIYLQMCNEILEYQILRLNFSSVSERVQYCPMLNSENLEFFKTSWEQEFTNSANSSEPQKIRELVYALLMMTNAKKYWEQIQPNSSWRTQHKIFREQLSLEIGEFYSRQDWSDPRNHIPFFFKTLYEFA